MRNQVLRFGLLLLAWGYPVLFLLLSLRDESPWLTALFAAAWGITCGGWLHSFCREEWLGFSMSFYGGVTASVTAFGLVWTVFTFLLGGTADGLCALGASAGICLPYYFYLAYGKWQDGRGRFSTGTPPTVFSLLLYGFVIALPFLRVGVRLLGEWLYRGHPHIAMEYYRNTPKEIYETEVLLFKILFLLSPVLCLIAKGTASRRKAPIRTT